MRPNEAQGGKGKAPRKRPSKRTIQPVLVYSDDSMEEDIPDHVIAARAAGGGAVAGAAAGGAAAAVRLPRQVVIRHEVDPENPLQLPHELLPARPEHYDLSDEEGEDHTGFWQVGDLEALILGLNHYRIQLKGKFTGTARGRERKARAWDKVAKYVNQRCATRWTPGQCKGKARRYSLDIKNKFNALRRELNKTGNMEIPEDMYLTRNEEMLLDYVGVEGVIGVPGLHGTSLRPDVGRDYLKRRSANARKAWDHERQHKPDYKEDLPTGRIRLQPRRPTQD